MPYASITTWKVANPVEGPELDAQYRAWQEKYVPMVLAMGATSIMQVHTGPDTSAIVTVWPDNATRTAAMEKIASMRQQGASEFEATMTMELEGEVRGSS